MGPAQSGFSCDSWCIFPRSGRLEVTQRLVLLILVDWGRLPKFTSCNCKPHFKTNTFNPVCLTSFVFRVRSRNYRQQQQQCTVFRQRVPSNGCQSEVKAQCLSCLTVPPDRPMYRANDDMSLFSPLFSLLCPPRLAVDLLWPLRHVEVGCRVLLTCVHLVPVGCG